VCQVYKGEIEEKLLSRYYKPLNGRNYLAESISGQAIPSFFAITALFLSKIYKKGKINKIEFYFFQFQSKGTLNKKMHTFFQMCAKSTKEK